VRPTDLGLSAEDLALRDLVQDLVEKHVAPEALMTDREARFPRPAMDVLATVGLLGIAVPEAYGGSGGTEIQYLLAVEELARACGSTSLTYMTQIHACLVLMAAGSEEQKHRGLPSLCDGSRIGAIALTEPAAGSDLGSLTTRARKVEDGYVLDGAKVFITNGGVADLLCVFARTSDDGARGVSVFVVEAGSPGLSTGEPLQKMGMRGSNTVEVFLDGVVVTESQRLGPEGSGFATAMRILEGARLSTAAQALGLAQGAFDRALAYARAREQFGRPIFDFQAVQFRLVDMHTNIAAARALLYQVGRVVDADPNGSHAAASAMVKVHCSDVAMAVTTDAVQTLGGYGYIEEYEVERFMRDTKVTQIYDGTNDINRLVVARGLGSE